MLAWLAVRSLLFVVAFLKKTKFFSGRIFCRWSKIRNLIEQRRRCPPAAAVADAVAVMPKSVVYPLQISVVFAK